MIVLDVLAILVATVLGISFYRSKEDFLSWLLEDSDVLRFTCIITLVVIIINRIDWSILMYKIF